MKKELLKVALVLFAASSLLMSCSDNDDHEAQTVRVLQNKGVFVVSAGNDESFTQGSITYYDYATQASSTLDSIYCLWFYQRLENLDNNDILGRDGMLQQYFYILPNLT